MDGVRRGERLWRCVPLRCWSRCGRALLGLGVLNGSGVWGWGVRGSGVLGWGVRGGGVYGRLRRWRVNGGREARSVCVVRELHLVERDGVPERAIARPPDDLVTELAARNRLGLGRG
jgi:hypothetical protein